MKRIFLFISAIILLFSCQEDDKVVFDVDMSKIEVDFEPYHGGAIMHYKLPDNASIYGVQAQYIDEQGSLSTVSSTYLQNQIDLPGFFNGKENIDISIRVCDNKGTLSKEIKKTFNVGNAPAMEFFEKVKVHPYWNGFAVRYECPDRTKGFLNVEYIGFNDYTQKKDTILFKTYPLKSGENLIKVAGLSNKEKITAVLWTEDFLGNRSKRHVYKDILPAFDKPYANSNFKLLDAPVWENNDYRGIFGERFLFDGDTKGLKRFIKLRMGYCFLTHENSVPGKMIIDIKQPKIISKVRVFARPQLTTDPHRLLLLNGNGKVYPRHMKVYVSNDPGLPLEEWTLAGEYFESIATPNDQRWVYRCDLETEVYDSEEALRKSDPIYVDVNLDYIDEPMRYITFEWLKVYEDMDSYNNKNESNYMSLEELEVFIKR